MKNFTLKATVAAVAAVMATSASATINMADSVADAGLYASERIANPTTISHANLDSVVSVGFGVSSAQTRYVKFSLTNATFATQVVAADLDAGVAAAGTSYAPLIAVSAGGATTDNYVIFQVTADTNYASTDMFSLSLGTGVGGVVVTSASAPVTLTYQLYETAVDAVNGSNALATDSETVATFGTGLAFSATTATTTADVTSLYQDFKVNTSNTPDGYFSTAIANIGDVTVGVTGALMPTGVAAVITDLLGAGTKLVVTGEDLSAAAAVALDDDVNCATPTGGTTVAGVITGNVADITIGGAAAAGLGICFTNDTATPITAQSFTVGLTVVPAAGATTVSPASVALGAFDRDGTVLKAPMFTGAAGQYTYVQLANMGSTAASYTVECFAPTGASQAGTGGSIAAGNTAKLYMNNLGCQTGANAAQFTFAVPSGNVIGSVVRQSTTTGDSALDSLVGNQ